MTISIDPKLSSVAQDRLFLVNIKSAFITALQAALDDKDYPEQKIQGIKISMEYPLEENQYPHLWVQFSFSKFQNAGIGYYFIEDNQIREEWYFEGNVRFTVISLTSFERDTYSSQLMQLLAFSRMHPIAANFDEHLNSYPNLSMSINRDTFTPEGQSVDPGTPWADDILTYIDSYSVQIIGQMDSNFTVTPAYLKKIQVEATGGIPGGDPSLTVSETFVGDDDGWV